VKINERKRSALDACGKVQEFGSYRNQKKRRRETGKNWRDSKYERDCAEGGKYKKGVIVGSRSREKGSRGEPGGSERYRSARFVGEKKYQRAPRKGEAETGKTRVVKMVRRPHDTKQIGL